MMIVRCVPEGHLKRVHPCFSCKLPDCDDRNTRCGLRLALTRYKNLKVKGEVVPEAMRQAKNIAYQELYGAQRQERLQAAREAGRS